MKREPAQRGTVRTSAIFIAAGRGVSVYRKLEEVPPRLRSKLVKSTAGANAGTVLIADRRGAQELLRENINALLDNRSGSRPGVLPHVRQDLRDILLFVLLHWRSIGVAGLVMMAAWLAIAFVRS